MKVKPGDKVVRKMGIYGVVVLDVFDRTDVTLRTGLAGPCPTTFDKALNVSHFRVYHQAKIARIHDLNRDIQDKASEIRVLFDSLEKVK